MGDGVVEILGARAPMTTCPGQKAGSFLGRELARINAAFSVEGKGEGLDRTRIGLDPDPASHIGRRLRAHLKCPIPLSALVD
jgi:hypothetical protein